MDNDSKRMADFLGIDRSAVEEIGFVASRDEVLISLRMKPSVESCPCCGSADLRMRGYVPKTVRDALFYGRKTAVTIRRRKYRCLGCGKTFYERDPLSAGGTCVTQGMVASIFEELFDYNETFASVARRHKMSATRVIDIFDRYYNPKRRKLPEFLCMDECYGDGNFDKPYALVMLNWEDASLVDVLKGRDKKSISTYLFQIPKEERDRVKVVSIDMWEPYLDIAKSYFKNAKVVVDSFHVVKNLTAALDKIRCRVMNGFPKDSDEYHYLKKYNWTVFAKNLDAGGKRWRDKKTHAWINAFEARAKILATSKDLATAHAAYVSYRWFNANRHTREESEAKLDEIMTKLELAKINEMVPFMTLLANWREYIVASFDEYIEKRRVSNGPIEGFNSQFKKLLAVSNGVKNFDRFRARLFLCSAKRIEFSPKATTRKRKGKKRGRYKKARQDTGS